MARIPKHELDELKNQLSLLALAQSQGHKFKRHAPGSYACLCPFHAEKTPSCVVTPRQSTKQDHFRGCVVVPVTGWSESANVAHRGRVLQLYGRRTSADNQVKKGSSKHLYLPSPLAGVWNEAALKASSDVILCEALIDAMTFWCAGFRNHHRLWLQRLHGGASGGVAVSASGG
jgi:DNA primase